MYFGQTMEVLLFQAVGTEQLEFGEYRPAIDLFVFFRWLENLDAIALIDMEYEVSVEIVQPF